MANIVVKDLLDSIELDRRAMRAITGGARTRGHPLHLASTILRTSRIIDYPTTLPFNQAAQDKSAK